MRASQAVSLLQKVRELTDADKLEGSPFVGSGIRDWVQELASGERGCMSDKALKFLALDEAVKQVKAARRASRAPRRGKGAADGESGSEDRDDDDVKPYEDGSLCLGPSSGKVRPTATTAATSARVHRARARARARERERAHARVR